MTVYFSGAALLFSIYMTAFLRDKATSKGDIASWIVIAIATLLWPITLPISLKELTPKAIRAIQPARRPELTAAANQ
jgi:Na+/proline symporter